MKYTLMLAADPAKAPAPGSPEEGRFFQAFFAFNQEIGDKGVYLGGEPLQDVSTATTIRVEVRPCIDYTQAMGWLAPAWPPSSSPVHPERSAPAAPIQQHNQDLA
jgi:hypothetical protein